MRPRTTVTATLAVGALAMTATAAMAGAPPTGPSEDPATHHRSVSVEDMASMHDDMHDAYPDMAPHMAEFGIDPDQMHDGMVQGHRHDEPAAMGHAHEAGGMHD